MIDPGSYAVAENSFWRSRGRCRIRGLFSLRILSVFLVLFFSVSGCVTFNPQPIEAVPFLERAEMQNDGEVQVTVAVPTAKESEKIFGVPLAKKDIQPVWVEVKNHDNVPYFFLQLSLDSDYYSPLEAAQKSHYLTWTRLAAYGIFSFFFLPLLLIAPFDYLHTTSVNERMDALFEDQAMGNILIPPGQDNAGFVFTNLDEGTKEVFVELHGEKNKKFTFFVPVPGLKADHKKVEFDALYPEEEIRSYDTAGLRHMLEQLPCCTTNEDGSENGDPLNLVVIGDFTEVLTTFTRRKWDETESIHTGSIWKTMTSFVFGARYRYSPVSPLYVFGRPQDIAFQRARDTIHGRNHIRLWLAPFRFQDTPVWIGQISRDIGVRFTLRTWNLMTHQIDRDVDDTRDSLLGDLIISKSVSRVGFVKGVGEVSRTTPRENLTGDLYFTDGLRGVVVLSPVNTQFQFFDWEPPFHMDEE